MTDDIIDAMLEDFDMERDDLISVIEDYLVKYQGALSDKTKIAFVSEMLENLPSE